MGELGMEMDLAIFVPEGPGVFRNNKRDQSSDSAVGLGRKVGEGPSLDEPGSVLEEELADGLDVLCPVLSALLAHGFDNGIFFGRVIVKVGCHKSIDKHLPVNPLEYLFLLHEPEDL